MNQPVTNYDHKTIQVRRGTTSEWRRYGTICIPAEGEICVEFFQDSDGTRNNNVGMKVGNGANAYRDLPYLITNQNMDDRISNDQITNWDDAYGWGDHALAGYLTQELDPIFTSSPASTITVSDIAKWNEAADGDKADQSALDEEVQARKDGDALLQGQITDIAGDVITDEERQKLNESHGWGDHSLEGYVTEELDPIFTNSPAGTITAQDIAKWNESAGEGNNSEPVKWSEIEEKPDSIESLGTGNLINCGTYNSSL